MQTFKSNLKSVISLSEHEHRPTVRKSYTCKYYYTCKFVKSALASHQAVRNVNKLTQERRRPYANIVKSALVSHRIASSILHTGSKPYTCNHCKSIAFGPRHTTRNKNNLTVQRLITGMTTMHWERVWLTV